MLIVRCSRARDDENSEVEARSEKSPSMAGGESIMERSSDSGNFCELCSLLFLR